jgi:hypothetical protein
MTRGLAASPARTSRRRSALPGCASYSSTSVSGITAAPGEIHLKTRDLLLFQAITQTTLAQAQDTLNIE